MSFHHPSIYWLLLLLLVPLIWWRWLSARRRVAVRFSSIGPMQHAGITWAVWMRWLVPLLRTAAVVLLVVALARPRQADEQSRVFTEGVAIELVVDRSGSMRALDFDDGRTNISRLDAVKKVVEAFVIGGDQLPGRPDDLIGLIAFARFADSRCPLTLDQDHLINVVRDTRFVLDREEDGTAIGDAVALGVERLQGLEERVDLRGASPIKSRVMILLTDGENNRGDIDPITAAQMAATFGIKIYTIGAGSKNGTAPMPIQDPFGRTVVRQVPVSIDEDTLREIADITGGQYFRATDTRSLEQIYAQIDELERTEIEQRRYTQYSELAVEQTRFGPWSLPPLLVIVLCLIAIELLLGTTRFRTLT